MKRMIQSLMPWWPGPWLRHPKRLVSPSSGDRSELTEEQVLAALTKPARRAFENLRTAADIPRRPGYVSPAPGYVWARRRDVDLLLAEMTVSVGIEVELMAAQAALARIQKVIYDKSHDPDSMLDALVDIIEEHFSESRPSS